MKEKEIKLIKDLYQHFQPQTEVTDELINSCYDQYGSIRGVLMNLVLKFEPNADVSDKYLDTKLAEYGISLQSNSAHAVDSITQQNQNMRTEPITSVTKDDPSTSTEKEPEENNNVIYIISGALALFSCFISVGSMGIAGIIGGLIGIALFGGILAGVVYIFYRKNFMRTFAICCGIWSFIMCFG